MKEVIIIGGGIAGLSAGVYAQKCGFHTTILESHNIPGGNCTSWKRKGYLFEGGMHWLTGSRKNDVLNSMWRHVGALNDSVTIHMAEPFMEYDHKGMPIRIYRDLERSEKHLLELSPADGKEIKKLYGYVRKVQNLAMPVTDIRGVEVTKKRRMTLSFLFSALPALRLMGKLTKKSRDEYINRFTHEGIRDMLRSCTTENSGIMPYVFTMGTLARRDGGFPEGGSLPFSSRIAETFTSLGGKILYNTRADRVIVENGKATGVIAGNQRFDADAVIVSSETLTAGDLFDVPVNSGWLDDMKAKTKPTMCTFISLGINADLKKYNHSIVFKLEQQIKLANETYEYLSVNNYAADPVYSPQGKTAMTIQLSGDTYDYWKQAKEEGRYGEEKEKIGNMIIAAIEAQFPEAAGQVEVCDVATPLTYQRYCGGWKGSWMTEMTPGMEIKSYPCIIKGLDRVYFAGHRLMPPGGLPVALMSGRTAVQHLCRDTGTLFISEEE